MKRRDFIAATTALSLLASPAAWAAKKQGANKASTKASKKPATEAGAGDDMPAAGEHRSAISLPAEPAPNWKTYEVESTVSLPQSTGSARIWLPLAQYKDTAWERSLGIQWQGNFNNAGIYRDPVGEMEVFYADWKASSDTPRLTIVTQVATQDRHFDITRRGIIAERNEVLRRCLGSSDLMPIDGIVRKTAERAIGRIKDPLAQAKAIYDWVVDNTRFDGNGPDVGRQNVGRLLEEGTLSGRSADIVQLFVALCRAIGIPARPVFGLRLDRSRLFNGLGVSSTALSQAQQCRAEFYIPGYSWIPVNPADVRQTMHDEHLSSGDSRLSVLKKLLFGFWEMNWISFNSAQDVTLRGSTQATLPYLLYPQAETAEGRFDSLDTQRMTYKVNARRSDV